MKNFLILFSIFICILCAPKSKKKNNKKNKNSNPRPKPVRKNEDKLKNGTENLNILSVAYELTYDKRSVLKVVLKSIDDIEFDLKFSALLKSVEEEKEYKLSCENISITDIECYSEKNVKFNLNNKYYFYYKSNGNLTLDEKEVMEDWKRVKLVLKPEMYEDQIMWKDHRKIIGLNDRKIVGGGYLYLVPKQKKLLHKNKDGFNRYIDLDNLISQGGLLGERPDGTLDGFKEAIRRGFHMIGADLQFTKDKIPVILHSLKLEEVSNGKGKISEFSLEELEKLDFGSKFDKKYAGEKILTFEKLLKLCKDNEVIIDLNLGNLDFKTYFDKTDEYMKIIINTIEKCKMSDSTLFNYDKNQNVLIKLTKIKKDISVSISKVQIDKLEKLKETFAESKRIVINIPLSKENEVDEILLRNAITFGYKIKVGPINDEKLANKLQSLGVNFMPTTKLHPFYIKNNYESPILLKCTQFDVLVDCRLGPEVKLIDNQIYSIYYTENIYNLYENISDNPIGEFIYLDTKKLDDLYYTLKAFDFKNSYLKLNSSIKIDKGKKIKGKIGPTYENVADCYLYNFVCDGNNKEEVDCKILKNDSNVVPYEGNYTLHTVEYYSLYNPKNSATQNMFLNLDINKNNIKKYLPGIIFIVIATLIFAYVILNKEDKCIIKKITLPENNGVPETAKLNK